MMWNTLTIRGLDRVIRGTPTPEENTGLFVKPRGFQGWEGLPPGRRESLARALEHGEHDVPVRLPARVITIDAWVIANSVSELRRLSGMVSSWGAMGDRFELTVDHQEQSLSAMVRRISAEVVDTGRRWGEFFLAEAQVQFVAADPRKYGETASFPAKGTGMTMYVFHRGNFPAHPMIEIPDAPSAYRITSPGGEFLVTGATPGGTHRVDLRTGRVFRDGVWMSDVGSGQTWAVPEGVRWFHQMTVRGRVLIPDTYV